MLADGEPITFVAAARRAHVSTWLLYAAGVREHVDAAIKQQTRQRKQQPETTTSAALQTDLALARQEVHRLREEEDGLPHNLQNSLGQQLSSLSTEPLVERLTVRARRRTQRAATGQPRAHPPGQPTPRRSRRQPRRATADDPGHGCHRRMIQCGRERRDCGSGRRRDQPGDPGQRIGDQPVIGPLATLLTGQDSRFIQVSRRCEHGRLRQAHDGLRSHTRRPRRPRGLLSGCIEP